MVGSVMNDLGGEEDHQLRLPGIPDDYLGAVPPALVQPAIKYAGAKRWLPPLVLPRLHLHLATVSGTYAEPFFGGGAMGLAIGWPKSVFSDSQPDLVNLYQALAIDPVQVSDALEDLGRRGTDVDTYYEIRREVWPEARHLFSQFEWAARVLYLNKCSFNGLFRVNRKGQFNVPWGDREGVALQSREHLRAAGEVLARAEIRCADFGDVLADLEARGDVDRLAVFADPPYGATLPNVSTRGAIAGARGKVFTGYTTESFSWGDQVRLAAALSQLARAGAVVVASNTWAPEILALYRDDHEVFQVGVRHAVGATGERRGRRAEMLAVSRRHAGIFDAAGADLKIARRKKGG